MDAIVFAPNSAIDSYYELDQFSVGKVHVAKHALHAAGGKGFNMARALKRIGGEPFCLGPVGGESGQFILMDLEKEQIPCELTWTNEESRRCVTLLIQGEPDTTGVLERGGEVDPALAQVLDDTCLKHADEAPFFVLTGSLPNGFPADYYANLVRSLKSYPVKVCLDASGEALKTAAQAGPALIKVNRKEFEEAFLAPGERFSVTAGRAFFDKIHDLGLETLVVTDGANGAYVFLDQGLIYRVRTPVESWVSTAGAGDTFLAGIIYALNRGADYEEACTFASAAAAANMQELGCGNLQADQIPYFLGLTSLETISSLEGQPWKTI